MQPVPGEALPKSPISDILMLSFVGPNAADNTLHIYPCLMNFAIQLMNNYLTTYGWSLLPPESSASQNYSLRPRVHNLQLSNHASHLVDSNFIKRMLFKNILL